MKKYVMICLALLAAVLACKKNAGGSSTITVLEAHTWYPYQVQVTIDDTIVVTPHGGGAVVSTAYQHFDTLITLDDCLQHSTYIYSQNGALQIGNACRAAAYDTLWTVVPNGLLASMNINSARVQNYYAEHLPFMFTFFPPDTTFGYSPTIGKIQQIDNSHFVFNNAGISGAYDFGTISYDTLYTMKGVELTTYKAQ